MSKDARLAIPSLSYGLYLRDGLPGLLTMMVFAAPSLIPRLSDANTALAALVALALVFSPGIGLVVNLASYVLVDGFIRKPLDLLFRLKTLDPRLEERHSDRRWTASVIADLLRKLGHESHRIDHLVSVMRRSDPSVSRLTENECIMFARLAVAAASQTGYEEHERFRGGKVLCRALVMLSAVVAVSLWAPSLFGGTDWGLSCARNTSSPCIDVGSTELSRVAVTILPIILLPVAIVADDYAKLDILERYLSLKGKYVSSVFDPGDAEQ